MEAVEKFWQSDEYAQVKRLREDIADCKAMVSETPADEQWMAIAKATEEM